MRAILVSCAVLVHYTAFLLAIAFGAPCAERCPDDGPDGRCPPACVSCPCSPRQAPPATAAPAAVPLGRREPVPAFATPVPSSPDARDIFHVPKRLLA